MGKKTQTVGREISRVGSTLSRNISLPLAALGAGAIKTAIDFESAFTGVRKTIDATEAQYRELERGIQAMAERIPASVEEISAVAEAAGQLGIKRGAILDFTKTMLDLGETTNLSADMAASSLARFANITGMSQKDFDKLGSTIVDLGNKGASTEAEITEMALRIAGAGKTVGLADTEILGFAESLSSVGIRADAGGSAISRVFITMANDVAEGGKALEGFADVAGATSAEFKEQFETDAAGATIAFIEGLSKVKKEGGNVFKVLEDLGLSEIRVRDALLRASGASDLFAKSQETAADAWRANNALSEEAEKRYRTTAAQLEILKNKFRNILARFGKDMMPFLKDAAEALGDLAKWFGNLSEEQRKNIIKWGALAIVLGPVVRLFGGITTAIGTIIRTGGAAATIVGKIARGLGGGQLPGLPKTPAPTTGTPPVVPPAATGSWGLLAARVGAVAAVTVTAKQAFDNWLMVQKETINANLAHADSIQSSHFLMVAMSKSVLAGTKSMEDFEAQAYSLVTAEGQTITETAELLERFYQLRQSLLDNTMVINGQRYSVQALIRDLKNIPNSVQTTLTVKEIRQQVRETGSGKLPAGRAVGGPVSAHQSYLVGERGPEVLTMGARSGYVMPNVQGDTFIVDARGSTMTEAQFENVIRRVLDSADRRIGKMSRARSARVA